MSTTRNPCRSEEVTIRFMKEGDRGAEPCGVGSALIDFA
jgi:hypothetical protein